MLIALTLFIDVLPFVQSIQAQPRSLDKVSVQLDWKFQFEYAGFIAAVEKGLYKDAGLDVTLYEYQSGVDTVAKVLGQKVNYGIHNSSLVITQGKIQPIVLLATYYQRSPLVFVTSTDIATPREMYGRRIMGTKDEFKYSSLALMLNHFGIDRENSQIIEHNFSIEDFINGKIDVMSAFLSNQIYELDQRGVEYNIIDPFDYGFFMSAVNLFTSREEALKHPERTRRFIEATNKGWEYALNHPEELIEIIHEKYAPEKSKEALQFEVEITKKLFLRDFYPIGAVNIELTMRAYKQLTDRNMIQEGQKLGTFLFEELIEASQSAQELNATERDYLFTKKEITYCIDPDWMPFEGIINDRHVGISADYFNAFRKKLPVPLRFVPTISWQQSLDFIKNRKCDALALAAPTKHRRAYLDFTTPHIILPVVLATRMDEFFIEEIESVLDRPIGLVKGYSINTELRTKYPDGNFVDVDSLNDGLEQVEKGLLFGYIDTLMPIADAAQKRFTGTIKISARLKETVNLAIATRNDEPLLHSIFQKQIGLLTPEQKQSFYNNWVSVKEETRINYILIWKLALAVVFILSIFLVHILQLRRYNRLLEKLSITDKLTGLYNRFKLDAALLNQEHTYDRYKADCGVIIVDIDYFKLINDTFGHQMGDKVLVEVAELLQNNVRITDILGRWGGEEFLIICPGCSADDSEQMAEKLRYLVCTNKFSHGKPLSASFGVSSFAQGRTTKDTLKAADDALYQAKNRGRNRTVSASVPLVAHEFVRE
ncbi:diguanylate cyclase [Desulfogranum japonicum]|uniref:diguanylate cyclase n=1 Tax=Desulfogranum japonicum TaxID=231447 RepID=UPI00041D4FDE|nr:diguanylate cyclase [Desulfogranum japonicum]